MDLQKVAHYATIGGFVVGCVMLYAVFNPPQQQAANAKLQGSNISPMMWLFLAGLLISAALHAYATVVQARTRNFKSPPMTITPQQGTTVKPNENRVFNSLPGPRTSLPDGREIVSCPLKELQLLHAENTLDQFRRKIVGVWVKTEGEISNYHGDGVVFLKCEDSRHAIIVLRFQAGWDDSLARLARGSRVMFRGVIADADIEVIRINECELL